MHSLTWSSGRGLQSRGTAALPQHRQLSVKHILITALPFKLRNIVFLQGLDFYENEEAYKSYLQFHYDIVVMLTSFSWPSTTLSTATMAQYNLIDDDDGSHALFGVKRLSYIPVQLPCDRELVIHFTIDVRLWKDPCVMSISFAPASTTWCSIR